MEKPFIFDQNTEYYLPEFYRKFKDKLPILAVVISGHYGSTQWNDFYDGMIIRFHQIHEVKRVIARESSTLARIREHYLSIPVISKHRFHRVLKKDTLGPEETMEDVLQHGLPRLIRFSEFTSPHFIVEKGSDLILLREYSQIFLQGNSFLEGEIQPGSVACFLCPHISVTPITGIEGKSDEEFQEYLDSLHKFVLETTTFRHKDCDLNVRQFHINDENIKGLVQTQDFSDDAERKVYSELAPEIPPRRSTRKHRGSEHCYEKLKKSNTEVETPVADRPYAITTMQSTRRERISSNTGKSNSDERRNLQCFQEDKHNDKRKHETIKSSTCIEELSVEGVTYILGQLNLNQYSELFANQAVDGELLQHLDAEMLMSEFGLTTIETKRLMLYVKKGHIPKLV